MGDTPYLQCTFAHAVDKQGRQSCRSIGGLTELASLLLLSVISGKRPSRRYSYFHACEAASVLPSHRVRPWLQGRMCPGDVRGMSHSAAAVIELGRPNRERTVFTVLAWIFSVSSLFCWFSLPMAWSGTSTSPLSSEPSDARGNSASASFSFLALT
jgi:hypothetical protein